MDMFFVRQQIVVGVVVCACLELTVLVFKALAR
jgi:hypothetical protein